MQKSHVGHIKFLVNEILPLSLRCHRGLRSSAVHRKKDTSKDQKENDSFANGGSASSIEGLYTSWKKNPKSVDSSWDAYFSGKPRLPSNQSEDVSPRTTTAATRSPSADLHSIDDHLAVQGMIRAYQVRGHLAARIDPLNLVGPFGASTSDSETHNVAQAVLREYYSYVFNDFYASFRLPPATMIGGEERSLPLIDLLNRLDQVYRGHIGVEYMHMTSLKKMSWIQNRFERPNAINFTLDEKLLILERLMHSTGFENFLAKKDSSVKRFGLEGCDIMVPVMNEIIDRATELGVESIFIGMAHRGRLNVIANVCSKPLVDIFSQFHGLKPTESVSGDVKYHFGLYTERLNRHSNKNVRITVVANPSHLEHVNPVLLGKARAEMFYRGDVKGDKVLPIIIHGDASFSGQGVAYESMHLSDLPAYTTHGTIHVVCNNQVGFTTDPRFARSSRYCTDVARVVNAPIFHVNADDPEASVHCARVAADWRAEFHKDVVIDIVGYRRNGHNEEDEPMFTQPLMYKRIKNVPPCVELYANKLINEDVLEKGDDKDMMEEYEKICEDAWNESKKITSITYSDWVDSPWPAFFEGRDPLKICPTGVSVETLNTIGNVYSSEPPAEHEFEVHEGIKNVLAERRKMMKSKKADWSMGEAFAIGALVKDGIHVRLSGQDVERGTFAERHHVLHHQSQDKTKYIPLQHIYPDQASYTICNSSLSECAILGFDHGFSMATPKSLVIWEAQFGDFANTAQAIIDTFITSGETKWVRQSGICVFLPHSLDGSGPDHSSGRVERILQLCDDDPDCYPDTTDPDFVARQLKDINWIVTNLSTPANLFHAMRRQVAMSFRKPLINFGPKSMLSHPLARSPFKDFDERSEFKRLIPEKGKAKKNPESVTKLIFCTGKVYYDLLKEREDHEQKDVVAIARVEQICPFPYDLVTQQIELYKNAELMWVQEEHKNQGAWFYVQQRFDTTLIKMEKESRSVSYHGRPPSASPASGNKFKFKKEYKEFMTSVFGELTDENKSRLEKIKQEEQAKAKAEVTQKSETAQEDQKKEATQKKKTATPVKNASDAVKNASASKKDASVSKQCTSAVNKDAAAAKDASIAKDAVPKDKK